MPDTPASQTRRQALKRFARYAAAAPSVMVLLRPREWRAVSIAGAAAAAPGIDWLLVRGGSQRSPADLSAAIGNQSYTHFLLGDGYFDYVNVTRSGITIKAQNQHSAIVPNGIELSADNVTIDGLECTTVFEDTPVVVNNPGCKVLNCHLAGWGKPGYYGNGIWILKSALDPSNKVLIQGNWLEDFGGEDFAGGIAVGKEADTQDIYDVCVDIIGNSIYGWIGVPRGDIYNSSIQWFHPANVYYNYCDFINGTPLQNKSWYSHIKGNVCVNTIGDGCLYNRAWGNNTWEYNIVHDCVVGVDHFAGTDVVYRGNLIYNCGNAGRIKHNSPPDSTNVTIINCTFANCDGGWIWDPSGTGSFGILWEKCIWSNVTGLAIDNEVSPSGNWDETDNLFYGTTAPTGTTGAGGTSNSGIDPQFVDPPDDFTAQAREASDRGAPWPLPRTASPRP